MLQLMHIFANIFATVYYDNASKLEGDSIVSLHQAFCIDFLKSKPEVLDFSGNELTEDLKFFNCKSPLDLNNLPEYGNGYDRRVFLNESDAESYLKKYLKILKSLKNSKICKSRELPCMLYKRRYIVQTLLGEKNQTFRHYKKHWQPGQLFNLHDQVNFLTVELISLKEVGINCYEYKFKLP